MTGEVIYDVPIYENGGKGEANLATTTGLRIRWRDAYTVIRSSCRSVRFGHKVRRPATRRSCHTTTHA
jgi:hypothetical protein